jgi:23S rRNA pseudouridine2605 synthase
MARESDKGADRKSRGSDKERSKKVTKKSGWSKPDGTPLRKRTGNYFPDKEIDKRKPAARGKYAKEGFPRDRDTDKPREFTRSDDRRPSRDDKPHEFTRSDDRRPSRDEKPREFKRSDDRRPSRDDKPREFKRSDDRRPSRVDKPREFKKSGSNYDDYKRAGSLRDRDEKPRDFVNKENSDGDNEAPKSRTFSKPAFERKSKKPFEKKRERYADKDHSKEMRGRFDKDRNKPKAKRSAAGPHRERKPKSDIVESKDGIRLNRYIANAGICSRREADDLISAGLVSINGQIVTELGTKVKSDDVVKFNDQTLKTEKLVYVLLNKPKDFLTTTDDPEERKTVMSLVKEAGKERIFPVGRLDRNTTGLLLLTNDGELTKRLTHPSGNIKKLYQVELDKNLTQADMIKAAEGVELEDGIVAFDEIQYASPDDKSIIGVELHSGKNRIVRRIFEAMGYDVRKLDRTTFAGLTKKDLPRGRWRFLTEMELNMLKMLTGKKR